MRSVSVGKLAGYLSVKWLMDVGWGRSWITYLRGHSQHLEAGRHVGEERARQSYVAEVHCERLAPDREVPDVEHRQFLFVKVVFRK